MSVDLLNFSATAPLLALPYRLVTETSLSTQAVHPRPIKATSPPVSQSFTDHLCLRSGLLLRWPGAPFPPRSPPWSPALQPLVCG